MKNRTLLAIACFALAALLVFAGVPFINGIAAEKTTVVQVNKNITAGDMVTEADVTTVEIGKFGVKADTLRQPEDVIGKYAATNLYPGTNLLPQMLTADPWNANAALEVLDGNQMAVSITVPSFASMLSGKLERGDVVSVVATDNDAAYIPESLRYVQIIATTTKSGVDQDESENGELAVSVTFLVNELQARELVYLEQHAKVHLCLAARADTDCAAELLAQQDEILTRLAKEEEAAKATTGEVKVPDRTETEGK